MKMAQGRSIFGPRDTNKVSKHCHMGQKTHLLNGGKHSTSACGLDCAPCGHQRVWTGLCSLRPPARVDWTVLPAATGVAAEPGTEEEAAESGGTGRSLHRDPTHTTSAANMGEEGPPSLEYIQAKDLFPQKELIKEEDGLQVPFPVLQGEGVEFLGRADDAIIAISNYRLHIKFKDSIINVPLRLIESVESREMFQLHIVCKDSKVVRCHFSTFKQCQEWLKRLNWATAPPTRLEDLFALAYHAWCLGACADDEDQHLHLCRPGDHVRHRMEMEVKRMGFDMQDAWRASDINSNYKLCSSYPQKLLVPVWITDKELESVASFRSWKRIPVVVYRHVRNGAVIARCSQPEISWWGWRNTEDEYLVTSIAKACLLNPGPRGGGACRHRVDAPDSSDSDFDSSLTGGVGPDTGSAPQKLLILDARSYTAAVANRAKGGGCECEEYYPNCEVMFMGMANIHSIRNSFQSLRAVCSQIPDPSNWLSALESTRWLQHLSVMLKAATLVCSAVEREGRPVLVHCSDGWDRTPQIVALAKVLLDPYYRTIEGFQVLVETEWLDFGHKFADRCGHGENAEDVSEQCPVFLQWLDCVHQLLKQFPCLFEFTEAFLVKLAQHTYSCLYGTFLCNNAREREVRNIYKRTCSVWSLLRAGNKNFQNFLYIPCHDMVLQPVCHTRALQLWTAVYLPTSSPCTAAEDAMEIYLSPSSQGEELTSRSLDRLPKTRSMDNLVSAFENGMALTRTSSDPNLNKHCQEERPPLEPMTAQGGGLTESPSDPRLGSEDQEAEKREETPPCASLEPSEDGCVDARVEPCLTTQPLPSLPHPLSLEQAPSLPKALPQMINLPLPPIPQEVHPRTAKVTSSFAAAVEPLGSPVRDQTANPEGTSEPLVSPSSTAVELLAIKQLSSFTPLEDSTDTLTEQSPTPPEPSPVPKASTGETQAPAPNDKRTPVVRGAELVPLKERAIAMAMVPTGECTQVARRLISQSQLTDLSLLGSHWDSVQGLVQSACGGTLQHGAYQGRRLAGRLLRAHGASPAGGHCCHHEPPRNPVGPTASGWISAVRSAALCASSSASPLGPSFRQILPAAYASPPAGIPPGPPAATSPAYLDDDGLPVAVDAVQQRLRQIEAGYKQEVEVLRRQVKQLQMKLERRQYCSPPSEPDIDYEDDITCLRESDDGEEEDSLSDHSEDRLSEGSWDHVERKDTEVSLPLNLQQVTRWVPDHMASHCFNCDSEFWIAKRRHHCRNCGNIFCKDCCHLKLPIPDQQLYDPVLVCNSCYDLLQESRTRELRSQQLKKPIATASS
ncbi:myotubularin-related protein 4 isoform X3 [Electrophorus electricus]|uniref:myotubularin-related protein 4 isoform X3 n=1 Tax=Electrophorus electricus TaxID=8005 RepID=UPI0015D07BFD|nr:myotubularin-related protein 4 isoform X3 [Electrophorus electricus]